MVVVVDNAVHRLEAYNVVEHDEHSLKEEKEEGRKRCLTYIRYVIWAPKRIFPEIRY